MGIPEGLYPAIIAAMTTLVVMLGTRRFASGDRRVDGEATVRVAQINDGAAMRKELQDLVRGLQTRVDDLLEKDTQNRLRILELEGKVKDMEDELVDARAEIRLLRGQLGIAHGGQGSG